MFRCPDLECTSCLTYNLEFERGICSACSTPFSLVDERCINLCGNGVIDLEEECDGETAEGVCNSECKKEEDLNDLGLSPDE